jgi:CubicO group peptidase (beta-lactamase class C family)
MLLETLGDDGMNLKKLILSTFVFVCMNASSSAQVLAASADPGSNALAAHINALIAKKRTPGLVLMIVKDRKVLLHEAYGYADLEKRRPLHRDDIFRLYSMSKPITAAAIMKLVAQGDLKLDTLLHTILPEFAGNAPITIRQLLTHTAGFPYGGDWKSLTGWRYWFSDPLNSNNTLEQMTTKLASLPLAHDPGKQWMYGMSSDLLGAVIEKVSGEPLEQFLSRAIMRPLKMPDTAFFVDASRTKRLVTNYTYDRDAKASIRADDGARFTRTPTLSSGGGGLVGNAADYMRFIQMLVHPEEYGHVLPSSYIRAMGSNQLPSGISAIPPEIYPNTGYGFGLGVKLVDEQFLKKGSIYWAGKGGTLFWADPKQGLAVVAMMQLEGARSGLEKRLVPWVDEWLRKRSAKAASGSASGQSEMGTTGPGKDG